jgi:hypothetical protein
MKKENKATANTFCQDSTRRPAQNCEAVDTEPKFDSPDCESKFRRALRNVPSKAFIERDGAKAVLCVRPFNLLELGASVNRQGLEQCRSTRKILRYLDNNQEEFLKFEHN